MATSKTQSLETMLKQRAQLDNRIAEKKQALATSIGTPFVTKFGSDFTPKDAALIAAAIEKHGCEKALSLLR